MVPGGLLSQSLPVVAWLLLKAFVVHYQTLYRYPLMREKCFGRCGGLALSRHSHLLPERPVSVLANNNLPSRFSGLITLLALHLA